MARSKSKKQTPAANIPAGVIILLLPCWLGYLGSLHWLLDLFSHFRWQTLILSLLIVLWSVWKKNKLARRLSLITAAVQSLSILLTIPLTKKSADPIACRIVSLNLLASNENHQAVREYLALSDADIIILSEVNNRWAIALGSLADTHPHHIISTHENNFGLACYSRLPIEKIHWLPTGQDGYPAAFIRVITPQGALNVIGIHPPPPMGGNLTNIRDAQLRAVQQYVKESNEKTIVCGDMNTTPWSRGMRILRKEHILDYRCTSSPSSPTWQVISPFCLPLDHSLATDGLLIHNKQISSSLGSDHRAIRFDVSFLTEK